MPHAQTTISPVSLVVRWPNSVPAEVADQVARRLSEARLASTWAIEEPAQAGILASRASSAAERSSALIVAASRNPAAAIDAGLSKFQRAGVPLEGVQLDTPFSRGTIERRLCQAGVRAIVINSTFARSSIVRPLPFGIWELGPHVVVPPRRKLLGLLRESSRELAAAADPSPAVATIDMARMGVARPGDWRSVDRLIQNAASQAADGKARIVSIAQMASELTGVASRPQRSILRAAA